jgi:hypothetical protein
MEHKKAVQQKGTGSKGPNMAHDGEMLALISEAAYGLYVKNGFIHGNDKQDWLEAEKMIYNRK